MSNIGFKRGLQDSLNKLESYTDGYFYLTTDTNKLYVAKSASELVDLTNSITIIDKFAGLPLNTSHKKGDKIGDSESAIEIDGSLVLQNAFYYVKDSNLLLLCDRIDAEDGSIKWIQINPDHNDNIDTYVTNLTTQKSANSTKDNLIFDISIKQTKHDLANNANSNIEDVTGTLTISAEDLATIATEVEVGVESTIDTDDNSITIGTSGTGAGSDSITIKGGDTISFNSSEEGSNIVILEANIPTYTPTIGVDESDKSKLVFGLQGEDEDNTLTTDSIIYNTITVDGVEKTVKNQGDFGSFYSSSKMDELLEGMNAMSYKGTLGSGEDATMNALPTENVKIGDTLMVVDDGKYGDYDGKPGDLFIAFGPEGEDGYIDEDSLQWVYISAGLDTDTTYSFACENNIIKVKSSTAENYTDLAKFVGGNCIEIETSNSEVTIKHADSGVLAKTYGPSENVTLSYGDEVTVPGFLVDAQGHITSAANYKYTLPNALSWEEF